MASSVHGELGDGVLVCLKNQDVAQVLWVMEKVFCYSEV